MNASLHLNLLQDDERFSSSPIRLRVMIPLLAVLGVVGLGVWWLLLIARIDNVTHEKTNLETHCAELKPTHDQVLALRAREKETRAAVSQLGFYRTARIRFGDALARLPQHVPASIQFTELRVPTPPLLPPPDPTAKVKPLGPTNLAETVTLRIMGRASSSTSSEAVRSLLEALRQPAFTNLIRKAEIPKGAFRQDIARGPAARECVLFEISCDCGERRFE